MKRLFLLALCLWHSVLSLRHNLVYQMDISEHCRRRVMPSIFLAGNVVDAYAYILHFSQTELPYTCYISVRSESGSNLIMVTKIYGDNGIAESCKNNNPELLVYEMGETFGGYWGPLSDSMFNQPTKKFKYYTLRTTEKTTLETSTKTKKTRPQTTEKKTTKTLYEETKHYVEVEVPLVDVSGVLMPTNTSVAPNQDALFDLYHDVTPVPNVKYDTRIIPIVQFSIYNGGRRQGSDNETGDSLFNLDVVEPYTADWRLTWPQSRRRTMKYRNRFPLRKRPKQRPFFNKNRGPKGKIAQHVLNKSSKTTKYEFPTTKALSKKPVSESKTHYSWEFIEELMNKINSTEKKEDKPKKSDSLKFLEKISKTKQNTSLYLIPNLTSYDNVPSQKLTSQTTKKHNVKTTKKLFQTTVRTLQSFEETSTTLSPTTVVTKNTLNDISTSTKTITTGHTTKSNRMTRKGMLFNSYYTNIHSSTTEMTGYKAEEITRTVTEREKRKAVTDRFRIRKREVHAIEIADARPHNITTMKETDRTQLSFGISDMQEFGELVELQDDDMYGHVTLRYLRKYVGPVFYNICSSNINAKGQQVQLFNSSRIIVAINNFTRINRMKIVLTSAKTLLSADLRCPGKEIECQVSGTRVCIDAMAACDGVPNCGSYEIYDEDRLKCGASQGLEHNVYVAAFTFIAVLLTALYAVHYWLKRCVPKVAEAFFVYTDGADNVLYLEPIMRSPHDDVGMGGLFYTPHMFDDLLGEPYEEKEKKTLWKKFTSIILCCRIFKKKETKTLQLEDEFEIDKTLKKRYSFAEFEINKMTDTNFTDMSVQTGSSLEMANMDTRPRNHMEITRNNMEKRTAYPPHSISSSISSTMLHAPLYKHDSILSLEEPFPEDHADELSLLKFLNENRRSSVDSTINMNLLRSVKEIDKNVSSGDRDHGEMELNNYTFESRLANPGPSGMRSQMKDLSRRIRFDENATTIPPMGGQEPERRNSGPRRSVYMDAVKGTIKKFLDTIDEDVEPTTAASAPYKELPGTNKDHKSFWGRTKGNDNKKTKKNTHVTLK